MYKQVIGVQKQFKQYSGDKNKITQNYTIAIQPIHYVMIILPYSSYESDHNVKTDKRKTSK